MTSFTFTILSSLLLLGAPEVHVAPFDAPMASGEYSGTRRVALAAAANEQEAFYLRLVNDETPRVFQTLEIDWTGPQGAIPSTYRIGGEAPTEALSPIGESIPLASGAEIDFLISLKVPEIAAQGTYNVTLRISFDSGKPERCSVQL